MQFNENVQTQGGAQNAQTASSNIQFLSAATALLKYQKLTAEVLNTKPAGCNSGELKALWPSDFFLHLVPDCF